MIATTARRKRKPVAPAEPKPYVPSPEFVAAYANPHNEIGPIISRWEGNRAVWLLPVNAGRVVGGLPRNRL